MELATMITTYGIATIAMLAFVVSVIIEVTKNLGPLKRIPTDIVVIALSIVVTLVAYFGMLAYCSRPFVWYEMTLAFVASFVVAFVAMFGWSKITELWSRFKK